MNWKEKRNTGEQFTWWQRGKHCSGEIEEETESVRRMDEKNEI